MQGRTDNPDGLELRGHQPSTWVDNQNELIVKVRLSGNYLKGRVVSNTTSPEFHTPTTVSIAGGRLLVANAEFFDQSEAGPPYYVVSNPEALARRLGRFRAGLSFGPVHLPVSFSQ